MHRNGRSEPVSLSFLVVTHAIARGGQDLFGASHNLVEYLNSRHYDVDFVLHPLDADGDVVIRSFRGGELVRAQRAGYRGRLREVVFNARRLRSSAASVAVLVDPLNYAAALVPFARRSQRLFVYYSVDYADRRFEDSLRNAVYYLLDRCALRHATVVWNASRRIAERRSEQGVNDADNVVIPNAPPFVPEAVTPWSDRLPSSVVFVGTVDAIFDSQLLVDAVALLVPQRPDLRVRIVGDGPGVSWLVERLRSHSIEQNVELCGYQAHEHALSLVASARVGLAFYSGKAPWNEFGDSLKVREYLSRGVPVVSTPGHPLAREVEERGAGRVVRSAEEAATAISELLEDGDGHAADRALDMAADADRDRVLDAALRELERRLRRMTDSAV